jgi:uncharacterized iron-regulated membrane protein
VNWRKYHRIISLVIFLPFLLMVITGLLLQVRQNAEFIQPKAVKMEFKTGQSLLSFESIISASKVSEKEIDQIIYKPEKFHLALRLKNGNELQVHPQTGEILKSSQRLTGLLIDLHQGSFFSSWGQYLIFLPAGLGVLFLLISGLIIYPWRKKRG